MQPADQNQHEQPFYQQVANEEELFIQAWKHGLPALIKGPTGCGKTRFVQYMAHKLNLPLYTVACHDDLSATDLVGRHLIGAEGTWWQDGPLTRAVREGGICYLDEVVEARQDTTVVLHPLADDRRELFIERTGETLDTEAAGPPQFAGPFAPFWQAPGPPWPPGGRRHGCRLISSS